MNRLASLLSLLLVAALAGCASTRSKPCDVVDSNGGQAQKAAPNQADAKAFCELAGRYSGSDEGVLARYYLGTQAADEGRFERIDGDRPKCRVVEPEVLASWKW